MPPPKNFVEKRKEHRLPYQKKIIFSDGKAALSAYGLNISRGGLFVTSLDPYPIDSSGHIAFFLPNLPQSLCVKAKVVHIVFDRQRCEIECGMGFQFVDLNESQKSILNLHILNEEASYMELKKILVAHKPNGEEMARCVAKLPSLDGLDLLAMRYRVNRICTMFEPEPTLESESESDEKMSA